jgi:hypothetical protein
MTDDDSTVLADFTLPARLRPTLAKLARVVLTDEVESLGLVDRVIDGVELTMRAIPAPMRAGLIAGLISFEAGALAWPRGRARAFSRLDAELAEAYFRSWWDHPLMAMRQFAKGIKGLIAMSYFELAEIRARMEYHPEAWIAKVAARRLNSYADDIRRHDETVLAPDPLVPAASLTKKVGHGEAA